MKVANLSILDRPSRDGLSFIKRHPIFQASGEKVACVNRSQKLLANGQTGSYPGPEVGLWEVRSSSQDLPISTGWVDRLRQTNLALS